MWRGGKIFVGKAADRITDLTRDRQAIFIRNAKCPHHIQPISQPAASADARRVGVRSWRPWWTGGDTRVAVVGSSVRRISDVRILSLS